MFSKRFRNLALVGVLLVGGLLLSCSAPQSRVSAPKIDNLVVILIDTLRSDHLPSYGYHRNTAPFLGQLADQGIQLQGYSVSSWTKPSIATMFTAVAPQRHQAISRSDTLPDNVPYLPQLLSEQGFSTATFIGNRNAGRKFGFARGFDTYLQSKHTSKVDGARVTDAALTVTPALSDSSRYFLYVHYVDPHDPYRPPQPWFEEGGEREWEYIQPGRIAKGLQQPSPRNLRRMVDQYDGEILDVDQQIQRLLQSMDQQGLLESTLVVITSDHGEEFLEHGELTHGNGLYEEVLQVPFILWMKGNKLPSYQTPERFLQIDFLPTVLEALEISVPSIEGNGAIDGESRWQSILEQQPESYGAAYFHLDLDGAGALASLEGDTKLIHSLEKPHDRLFDLAEDPGELRPTTALIGKSLEKRRALISHHNRMGILANQRSVETLDDETRRSLIALGYLDLNTPEEELRQRYVPPRLPRESGFNAPQP
ncbi:MAG: sulfatase [Acidobacteriota bacterium]